MAFQSAVNAQIALGVVGELAFEGPLRAQPAVLRSTDPANNVVGRAARIVSGETGSWAAGSAGAADPKPIIASMDVAAGATFAGLLVNPKVYASGGTVAGGPLAATMTLPNETPAELATEGDFIVNFIAATAPGDVVYYRTADGVLVCAAKGAAIPANCEGPIGTVERLTNTAAGIGIVHLEPRVPSVAP